MVHGIAGSAALTLLVLTMNPSAVAGLIYIIVFGLGSVGGMLIVSSLIGLPFVFTPKRFHFLNEGLQATVGLFSLTFGLFLAWQYCFHDHLIF
jgi:high-affinity nickel-transport protein